MLFYTHKKVDIIPQDTTLLPFIRRVVHLIRPTQVETHSVGFVPRNRETTLNCFTPGAPSVI